MNKKRSSNTSSLQVSTKEDSIIKLLPCEYDSSENDDCSNSSQVSIESSELVDSSDNEAQNITEIHILNKKINKAEKKDGEKIKA